MTVPDTFNTDALAALAAVGLAHRKAEHTRAVTAEAALAALREAVRKVCDAIENPGPVPLYHYATMRSARRAWPRLWRELDRLRAACLTDPAHSGAEPDMRVSCGYCGHGQGDHLNTPHTDRCTVCTCPEWTRPDPTDSKRGSDE